MKVALELQPCCGNRSGIGFYTYELARRLHGETGLEFVGNIFNFAGRNDNSTALKGITIPIQESKVFPYGVYRRIWNIIPISYRSMFPAADLTVFFNFIVVDPAYRGQKIGRHMVEEMLKTYKDFPTRILLANDQDVAFYKKCGFSAFEGKTPLIGRQGL